MKVLCSQEVVSPPRCEVVSCQVTAKASAPQVPWFVLCWWLQQGIREDRVWYKPIDFYALSCSSFRKSTRNLIEIAQRKSQTVNFFCRLRARGFPKTAGSAGGVGRADPKRGTGNAFPPRHALGEYLRAAWPAGALAPVSSSHRDGVHRLHACVLLICIVCFSPSWYTRH